MNPVQSRRSFLAATGAAAALAVPVWGNMLSPNRRSGFADTVDTFTIDGSDKSTRVALASVQGLVARRRPSIYLYQNWDSVRNNKGYFDWYTKKGWVRAERSNSDAFELIDRYRTAAKGLVVVDPDQEYTLNVATNVAGVEDLIIAYPDVVDKITLPVVRDLRGMFDSPIEGYRWAYEHCWREQSREALCCFYYSLPHDYQRDIAVQDRLHTFWLPGPDDPDHSDELDEHVQRILRDSPSNIPVLGFWASATDEGQARGVGEYAGVKLAGDHAKYTWVSDWVGNYSFHRAAPVDERDVVQRRPRRSAPIEPDPSKTYVSLVMIESGDSPAYLQYGLRFYQWDDPVRGQVPISYGITPAARALLPGILAWLYETATPNDYFFSAISGAGYCYPLEGYGRLTRRPEEALDRYFRLTDTRMTEIGLDRLGLYSHPFTPWTDADRTLIAEHVAPNMPNLRSIVADMGRDDGISAANANERVTDRVSMHHTLTRWSSQNWIPPYDTSHDVEAAAWLAGEIRANSAGGGFVQAMFYSWHYGPRRLRMVADLLEPEGYVFVTEDEFDRLWRLSR